MSSKRTFDERKEVLERKHLTSSALIKQVIKKQTVHIAHVLAETGYYMGGHIKGAKIIGEGKETIDNKEYHWYESAVLIQGWGGGDLRQHGKIKFSKIRSGGGSFIIRDLPEESDRAPKEALSMTCSNRGDSEISRTVSREVSVGTRELKKKEDNIHWDIELGFSLRSGVEGNDGNFGATTIGEFNSKVSLGGNHAWGSEDEDSETITRTVSDTFEIPAKNSYKLVGTVDEITLEQGYRKYYPIDFDISFAYKDFGLSKREIYYKYWKNDDGWARFKGIDDLISAFLGYPIVSNRDFQEAIEDLVTDNWEGQKVLGALENISDKDQRMIVSHGKLTYKDASDISIDVFKLGEFDDKGELVL